MLDINPPPSPVNPFQLAKSVVSDYFFRIFDEAKGLSDGAKTTSIQELIKDVKSSSRFENITSQGSLESIFKEVVMADEYSADIIRGGVVELMLSLAAEYEPLLVALSTALTAGMNSPLQKQYSVYSSTPNDSSLFAVLKANHWLVFCLIARYADCFNREDRT